MTSSQTSPLNKPPRSFYTSPSGMHFLRATSSSSLTTTEILSAAHAAFNPKHTSTSEKSGIGTKPIINCQLHTHEKDAPSSTPDSEPSIDSAPDDHLLAMVDDTLTSSPNSSDNTQLLSTTRMFQVIHSPCCQC